MEVGVYDSLNQIQIVMVGQIQMSMYSYMLGLGYIDDLEDGYTNDVVEDYTAELIDMRFVFFSEDFDQCSDEINVVGLIFVSIPSFTPNYTVEY